MRAVVTQKFRRAAVASLLLLCCTGPKAAAGPNTDSLLRAGRAILYKPSLSRSEFQKLLRIVAVIRLAVPDTGAQWAGVMRQRAAAAKEADIEIAALYLQAAAIAVGNKFLLAEKMFAEGAAKAKRLDLDSLHAQGLSGIGSARWQSGRMDEGLDMLFAALRIREAIGDHAGIANSHVTLGRLYYAANRLPEAERYLDRALEYYATAENYEDRSYLNAIHTKANIAGMAGRISEALRLDSMGLAVCASTGNMAQKTIFLDNIANCYAAEGRWAEAESYYRRCFAIDSSFNNWKDVGDTWSNLATLSEAQGHNAEAIARFQTALRYATRGVDLTGAEKIHRHLARLYRDAGMPDSAFVAMQAAYQLRDSVLGERTRSKLDELNALYESEQKERRIAEQSFALTQRNYLLAGAGALLLVTGAGGWSYTRRQRLRERLRSEKVLAQQREEATRAIIVAEEEERSRLGRELHDGVGQIISAAKMHLTGLESDELPPAAHERIHTAIELVDNAAGELRALSHGMAPEPLLGVGLARAAQDMLQKMQTGAVRMEFHADELPPLPIDTTVVVYRILQEAAQNAIRHGRAKHLAVTLNRDADHLTLLIEDDGTGFDTSATSEGIGLANMRKRAKYLKGSLEIDSAPGRGTTLAVHVPI